MKVRKKPVVVEAVQWTGNYEKIKEFMVGKANWPRWRNDDVLEISTLEGVMEASLGDWIIQGVNGEFYPCKPDIFEKTYDSCEEEIIEQVPKDLCRTGGGEMKGDILSNRSAIDRSKTEFYPTPPEVTIALLKYLKLPMGTKIWEPACGEGHMAEIIKKSGYEVVASDINDFGYGLIKRDYINNYSFPCDWIITNPPFSLSEEFIRQSIKHVKPFALLLKSQYWHSKKRVKLFNEFKPKAILPLTWRPDFLFGKKGGSPTMECIWTIWGTKPAEITEYKLLEKPVLQEGGRR